MEASAEAVLSITYRTSNSPCPKANRRLNFRDNKLIAVIMRTMNITLEKGTTKVGCV